MSWLQLTLTVDREEAPLIEAALQGGGALAVTADDASDSPILEPELGTTPLWPTVRLTALFDNDPQGELLARSAAEALRGRGRSEPEISTLDDRPWERVWMDEFHPQCFGRRLWVCPRGQRPELAESDAVFLDLDPGLAFGTGHHPTTALCLKWLDGQDLSGRRIVDYGCGSGILAIAALKLGADAALAVDHDVQALQATRENAEVNGVGARLRVVYPDELSPTDAASWQASDLVVANILAGPLLELRPALTRYCARGGLLGLSGLLAAQSASVADAYSADFLLDPVTVYDDWALLVGRRR